MKLGIRHAALPAKDLKRAQDFYINHIGFKPYKTDDPDWSMLILGDTTLSIVPINYGQGLTNPGVGVHHLGIVTQSVQEVDEFYEKLKNVPEAKAKPPKLHRDKSYGFYFFDTEGNPMECIWIPYLDHSSTSEYHMKKRAVALICKSEKIEIVRKVQKNLLQHLPDSICEILIVGKSSLKDFESKISGFDLLLVYPFMLNKAELSTIENEVKSMKTIRAVLGDDPIESFLVEEALVASMTNSFTAKFA